MVNSLVGRRGWRCGNWVFLECMFFPVGSGEKLEMLLTGTLKDLPLWHPCWNHHDISPISATNLEKTTVKSRCPPPHVLLVFSDPTVLETCLPNQGSSFLQVTTPEKFRPGLIIWMMPGQIHAMKQKISLSCMCHPAVAWALRRQVQWSDPVERIKGNSAEHGASFLSPPVREIAKCG